MTIPNHRKLNVVNTIKSALADRDISRHAGRLYIQLVLLSSRKLYCSVHVSTVAQALGLSRSQIARHLRELEEAKYIRSIVRPGRSSIYCITRFVSNSGEVVRVTAPRKKQLFVTGHNEANIGALTLV